MNRQQLHGSRSRFVLPLLAAFLLASQSTLPARSEMCSIDPVPAATLLLPHFEVDYLDVDGLTTFYRLINVSPEPTLLHVTFWTQWGYPSLDFDIFLTGYDVVAFNLRDMFFGGNLPITGDHQSDPLDTTSPHGNYPELDGSFSNCQHFFPFYDNPLVRGNALERIQDGHTGKPISFLAERCLGPDHGDTIARGYITFDVSQNCHTAFPIDSGYFVDGGLGFAIDENRVYGDWQIYDPASATAYGGPMVSIEADSSFNATSTPTGYTFWGTATANQLPGADNREPLGAVWDFRLTAGATSLDPLAATDILVWRDSTSRNWPSWPNPIGFECGVGPDWAPLSQASLVCWDEEENPIELCSGAQDRCFPLANQRVSLDQGLLAVPFSRGFCRLDTNAPNDSPTGDVDFPPGGGPTVQQSFVSVVRFGANGVGGAQPATPVRHTCDAPLP